MQKLLDKVKGVATSPVCIIAVFIFFSFFRNFIGFTNNTWGSFIFGDTAIYSTVAASIAQNITTVFGYKNNFLFWNPSYLSVGLPTLSVVDLGVLYPPTVFVAILARLSGNIMNTFPLYTISIFLHLLFSSYFVYRILTKVYKLDMYSSLFGAFLWAFAGFNLEFIGASAIFFSGSYLPVCFYLKSTPGKKPWTYYYLFLALSFLGGYPIVAATILLTCFVYSLYERKSSFGDVIKSEFVGLFLITFPIISPLYFSTALNFGLNIRSLLSVEGFLSNAANLGTLLEAIVPKNTVFNTQNSTNLVYMYFSLVGTLVLLQATNKTVILKDKKNLFVLILGLVGVLLALGGITIIPVLGYFLIPAFSFFRRLSVFVILPQFAFCLLIPQFIKTTFQNNQLTKSSEFILKLVVVMFIVPTFLFLLDLAGKTGVEKFYMSFSITLTTLIFVYLAFFLNTYYPRLAKVVLVFAIFLESSSLILSKFYLNSSVNPRDIFTPNRLITQLQKIIKPMERVELLATQYNYTTDHLNLEQSAGYLSLASAYGVQINEVLNNDATQKNLRDILGIRYVLRKTTSDYPYQKLMSILQNKKNPDYFAFDYSTLKWIPEPSSTEYSVYKRSTALPRLYIASAVHPAAQDATIMKNISTLELPTDVLVGPKDFKGVDVAANGQVTVLKYFKNYVKAQVTTTKSAFLANSTGYYPGWWAKINGKWVRPVQTNWFMQGVYVPQGVNIIEFLYIPYGFILGSLYIFAVTIVWIFILKNANKFKKIIPN